jgi:signal transduction histidine kinase
MLYEFLIAYRDAIVARTQARVASRTCPKPREVGLAEGISVFVEQLTDALYLAKTSHTVDHGQIAKSAGKYGRDRSKLGLTVAQVVHDYGDICQAITELATDHDAQISTDEFQTLNLCLDDAIAEAVTEYARQREDTTAAEGTERLGILAHELRNELHVATLSFESIRAGQVTAGGSTGLMHGRALTRLRDLVERSLAEVRLDSGIRNVECISAAQLIEELEIGGMIQARSRGLQFAVGAIDPNVTIEGDRHTLNAAVTNLLQNAFKFTKRGGTVSLATRATPNHVLFEVEDECGGLPPGKIDELFVPFSQRGQDRSGMGLGLSIALKAAQANAGDVHVRDLPGKGCIFTLELPRIKAPSPVNLPSSDAAKPHGHDHPYPIPKAG